MKKNKNVEYNMAEAKKALDFAREAEKRRNMADADYARARMNDYVEAAQAAAERDR